MAEDGFDSIALYVLFDEGEGEGLPAALEEELMHLSSMGLASRRRERLLSRALARLAVGERCQVPPGDVVLARPRDGGLEVAYPRLTPALHVSLTHTPGLVAFALTQSGPLGVDAERLTRPVRHEAMAARFFCAREASYIAARTEPERGPCFFRYFTAKEAYLKALGCGLGRSLSSFAFALEGDSARLVYDEEAPREARCSFFTPRSSFLLALVVLDADRAPCVTLEMLDSPRALAERLCRAARPRGDSAGAIAKPAPKEALNIT